MNRIFRPEDSTVSAILPPGEKNPRNSEGDFIRLKDGRILFAFSYYNGDSWDDDAVAEIRCIVSEDEGRTFSAEPRLLMAPFRPEDKNLMSVSLMRMDNGDIGLFYLSHKTDGTSECFISRSDDECESFYRTDSILPGGWRGYYVLNNCRIEKLSDGRLLAPVALHEIRDSTDEDIDYFSAVRFFCSEDDGFTWNRLPAKVQTGEMYNDTGLQEPGVIELPGGALYAYFRTHMGCQYEALSPDAGAHWFGPRPSRFSSAVSPMKISRNPYTGKYYAVWNPVPEYVTRKTAEGVWFRTPLAIAESVDGFNFDLENTQLIEDDPDRGYCYPAVFFADEKTILLAYCSGGAADGCTLNRLTIRRIVLS